MPRLGQIRRQAQTAALLCGLCLFACQQLGSSARLLAEAALGRCGATPGHALAAGAGQPATEALSSDRLIPCGEAVLTERRAALLAPGGHPKPPPRAPALFHNNCRPVVLRTRAVFCAFTRLRHILHPHLALLAHAASVLC